jgi:gliding motility associated protien GldN
MKKLSLYLLFSLGFVILSFGQDVMDGIYVKGHVPARKPIPYYHLREADATWSKKVWRMLDLKEKLNHPLYYPTEPMDDRRSLMKILLDGIQNNGITVYDFDIYGQSEFNTVPLTLEEVNKKMGGGIDTSWVPNLETGMDEERITPIDPKPEQVLRMFMKEEWVFDKQRAKMEVRIIGLAPVRWYAEELDIDGMEGEKNMKLSPMFWAYFPAYRELFAQQEVFNPYNDAERRTFEDIFFKRKFSSHIYRITNNYDNREITSYKNGEDALMEAERIKEWMFKFEHDLWEF